MGETTVLLAKPTELRTYSKTGAYAVVLNFIIGTGCFGLPYAFAEAGIVLTALFLTCGALLATVTATFTLETMARAQGLATGEHGLAWRKYDFTSLGRILGGSPHAIQAAIVWYCVGALWSFGTVFGSTVASVLTGDETCDDNGECQYYGAALVAYACLVLPLTLRNLGDQALVQTTLFWYRIVALVVMVLTLSLRVASRGVVGRHSNVVVGWRDAGLGFGLASRFNCHFNLPDALQPLDDKRAATGIVYSAILLAAAFYVAFGTLGALAFDPPRPLATLNWDTFTACGPDGWGPPCGRPLIAALVRYVVLFFPVVNVTSAYPLVAQTAAENLIATLVPQDQRDNAYIRACFRFLTAAPPLLLALFFRRLAVIFSIAGLLGFLLGLCIPCWFQLASLRACQTKWPHLTLDDAATTPFAVPWIPQSPRVARLMLVATLALTGLAAVSLLLVEAPQ